MDTSSLTAAQISQNIDALAAKQSKKTLAIWAANCAQHVLHLFADEFPDDNRPNRAIKAVRKWSQGKYTRDAARQAAAEAHDAAREVERLGASHVAWSAGHAAATAHMSSHALYAAAYALKAVAATTPPAETETAMLEEAVWQYDNLQSLIQDSNLNSIPS